jgi:hypothetical protein
VREKVEVSIGRKLRNVFTKENSSSQANVNVKFNGVLKFPGTFKIRGFDTFSISKSRGVGCHISHGHTLKLSGRRRLHVVYVCYV